MTKPDATGIEAAKHNKETGPMHVGAFLSHIFYQSRMPVPVSLYSASIK